MAAGAETSRPQVLRPPLQGLGPVLLPDEIPATSTSASRAGGSGGLVGAEPPLATPHGALGASNHVGAPRGRTATGAWAAQTRRLWEKRPREG